MRRELAQVLGVGLIVGGVMVGGVLGWLMWTYYQTGQFTAGAAIAATLAIILLLVVPQVGLGLYFLWHTRQ
jgi:hypothetical protein